ncbi:hypothetical protein D3C72_2045720 [compost metagenome]
MVKGSLHSASPRRAASSRPHSCCNPVRPSLSSHKGSWKKRAAAPGLKRAATVCTRPWLTTAIGAVIMPTAKLASCWSWHKISMQLSGKTWCVKGLAPVCTRQVQTQSSQGRRAGMGGYSW